MPSPAHGTDSGVVYLTDPYLSGLSLNDFPRLKKFHDDYFDIKPEICAERADLLTPMVPGKRV